MGTVVASQDTAEPVLLSGAADMSFRQVRALAQAFGVSGGVVGYTDLKVTAPGGLSVSVAAGFAMVKGSVSTGPDGQYSYPVPLAAAKTLGGGGANGTITAPTSATRRDQVVLRVYDEADAPGYGGLNKGRVEYIQNATETLTAEALPPNSLLLAYVDVTVGAVAITTGMITDRRWSVPVPGREVLATSTADNRAYAQITATPAGTTLVSTAVDVVGLSITINGDGATPMEVEGWTPYITSTAAAGTVLQLLLVADSAVIWQGQQAMMYGANAQLALAPRVRVPAFTGSKTFALKMLQTAAGTMQVFGGATAPSWIRARWA